MNRQIILLLVLITFSQSYLYGQKVLWGKMEQEPINGMLRDPETLTDQGIYAVKGYGGGPYSDFYTLKKEINLEKFDLAFNLKYTIALPLPDYEGSKVRREGIVSFAGKELLFSSCVKGGEQIYLFTPLSPSGVTNPYNVLGRLTIEGKDPAELVIIKKNDKLFIHNQNSKARKNYSFFYTFVLNKNLQVEVTNKVKLDLPSESYSILKCEIDRFDNWHLLVKNKSGKDNTETSSKKEFEYQLFSLMKGAVQQTKIVAESKAIKQIKMSSQGDDLIITGFYSDKIITGSGEWKTVTIVDKQSGVFYGRVNSLEPFKLKIANIDFGPEFIDVEDKKDSYVISADFLLQDISVTDDGKCYIFSEEISNSSYGTFANFSSNGAGPFFVGAAGYTIYYRDILIIELDKEGKIKRHVVVRKKQDGKDSLIPYCSYVKSVKDGKIRLVFSDDNKNIPGENKKAHFKNSNYAITVVCTIDEQSNEKRVVVDFTDEIGLIKISEIIKKNESEFVVYKNNTRAETFMFGVLKLE
ncbi:MAG: hypothetical protein J7604_16400 [Sporocytophaga sp.]|uniref:hypothetical protein n=1 Tax=Sporocytophaga sp. TaxID=2231183 RepID=UPI001B24C144|nr:hypothetical protein [Sporocytophaga sp.]MBO9701789.1 hypothetical protein [Sporocytophaga sp.]